METSKEQITVEFLKKLGFTKIKTTVFAATCDIIGNGYELEIGKGRSISIWSSNNKEWFKTNSRSDNKKINNIKELKDYIAEEFESILLERFNYVED